MFSRLVRGVAALCVAAVALFAQPAFAETVNNITVATTALPNATHGPYSHQIVATSPGYAGSFSFQRIGGQWPSGLVMSSSGLITGTTCDVNGLHSPISVRVTMNSAPFTSADLVTFNINVTGSAGSCQLTMAAAPPNGVVGTPYSASLAATGGSNPKTYSLTFGSLPPGLTLNAATGAITGTPTVAGPQTFDLRAVDGSGRVGTRTYTITINAPLAVTPTTLPNGTTTVAYSQAFGATGGTGPYTFSLGSGALPNGLALAGGTLSGTPTKAGSYTFSITATDATSATASRTYTVVIAGSNTLTVNPATLPNGLLATAYSQSATATGGTAPYTFSISAGALPAGLAISTAGAISGTPTAAGSYNFAVRADDANGNFGARAYTVVIGGANTLTIAPASIPAGTRNAAYSQTITASGGTPTYAFTLDSGTLPAGITLASNGTLAGTPTATGTFNFVVRGTDAFGNFGTANYSLVIAGATLTMSPSTLANGTNGVAASTVNFTTTGGTAPYGYAVTAGALPNGLTLASNGTYSGTPATLAGTYNFSITSTDAFGDTTTRGYAITIASASVAFSPASLSNATINAPYSATFSASGGAAPYAYAVTSGTLPPGLSLVGGVLSGTPTAAGTYTFSITATDANGDTHTTSYTFTVDAVTIGFTPASLPNGTNGAAYSQSIVASGGTGPYTYVVDSGTLPNGLVLANDGTLSGTPAGAGTYNFVVRATDAATNAGTQSYTVTIAAATITVTPASLSNAAINTAYNANFAATGGAGGYSYSVTAGSLPAGLTLTGGSLSGAPTATGTFNFTITVTDSLGDTGARAYALVVDAVTIALSPSTLPGGTNATAYSESLSASGGTGPYTYSLSAGSLPIGLSLSSTGTLSGTPSAAGSYNFTVTATDANTNAGSQAYTVVIASATISITPNTLPNATNNVAYSESFTATGGAGPYSFSLSAGSLPVGMSFSSAGVLSGTPTGAGTFNFTITVTDANGDIASQAYTFVVDAVTIAVSPASLPGGTNASAYSETLSASGGTGPYTYALSAGSLPIGLSFSSTGTLSGTPTAAGTYNFTVTATDANTNTGSQAYSVVIAAATIAITPASLPNATPNVAYSETLTASGGAAPYTFSLSAGALPVGVAFSSAGVLSGTPTTAGTYNFTITATDANGDSVSQPYTFVVDTVTITLPTSLSNGVNATAYSQSINASGGAAPYTYAVTSGTLPTGLALASNGTLSGSPTAAGTYTFTITATDANTNTGSQAYSVAIANATITITPASLPNCTNGTAYSHSLSATGGTGTYTFALAAGTMPVGMSLTSSGVFAGTPSSAGTFNFTVRATDGNGDVGTQAYSLAIGAASIDITPAALPGGRRGDAYSQALSAEGGTGPYTYAIGSGALPGGVTLAANGALSGTPTATGTFNVRIDAKDANGDIGQRTYAIAIAEAIALDITPGTLANGRKGTAVSTTFLTNGGTSPYTYAITGGALPSGVTLAANGTLSGTPTATGSYSFTVRSNDNAGHTGTRAYAWIIAAALRADPRTLRDVRDTVTEQLGAARRLGELQMGNVFRRLDSGTAPCATAEGDTEEDCKTHVEVWANGTRETSYVGTTSAISAFTVGADMQLGPARVGAAFGDGSDVAELASGYRGDVDGKTWMLYGRVGLGDVFGIAAVAGRTDLDLDSRRMNDGAGATFGQRHGSTDFVGVELNATLMHGDGGVVPYIRYETASTDLDAYAETGGTLALQYGHVSADNTAFVAGAEAFITKRTSWGSLTPRIRAEYRDRSGDDVNQALWYVDTPNESFVLGVAGIDDRGAMVSMGLEAAFKRFRFSVDVGSASTADDWFGGTSIRFQLRADF